MRATLRDEFSHVYVVNLRGDAYKSKEERQREGHPVFGQGSRNGAQITVLVRNPSTNSNQLAMLRYAEVPEYSTLADKFAWLADLGDVTSPKLVEVPVNDRHDWVNLTDGTYEEMLPVCTTAKTPNAAAQKHARGVATNLDSYVYSYSRTGLIVKIRALIEAYEEARELYELGEPLDAVTENYQLEVIKWTETLKQSLKHNRKIVFDESRIREVLYRPFTKLWLYEDDRILSRIKTISAMFPRSKEREQFSSPPHPTPLSSASSQPAGSGTSSPQGWQQPAATSPGSGEPDNTGSTAPVRDNDLGDTARASYHRSANAQPPKPDVSSITPPPPGGDRHLLSQQPDHPHSPCHQHPGGPLQRRNQPAIPDHPSEALLINLTQQLPFGILATDVLLDLCATGRQTRAAPRSIRPSKP